MPTAPAPQLGRTSTSTRSLRSVAIASITLVIGAGLVVVPATPEPAAAAPLAPETFLVSPTDQGSSTEATITPDGQHVAFTSTATDLVSGDTNGVSDVFLATAHGTADPFGSKPILISAPDASLTQEPANGPSSDPIPSADGRYVAFLSSATNLTADDYDSRAWIDVYVRDTLLGTTIRLDGANGQALGNARSIDMSDDGRYVTFISDASTIVDFDLNNAQDGFIADLDANGDGTRGDVTITSALSGLAVHGMNDLVISGNGEHLAFTVPYPLDEFHDGLGNPQYLYRRLRVEGGTDAAGAPLPESSPNLISTDGRHPAISGNGEVVIFISDYDCNSSPTPTPTIVASTYDSGQNFLIGVGTFNVAYSVGNVAAPAISADGSRAAWQSTQPLLSAVPRVELAQPVIRWATIGWKEANTAIACSATTSGDAQVLGTGEAPTLSASGRTAAFSGSTALSSAPAAAIAVDTHSNDGLSVTSTQGALNNVGYMAVADISKIPVSTLTGYASALANAPIYRLPIYRLPIYRLPIYRLPIYRLMVDSSPIYRLPIYRLPIYRLPIYRLDIPGGWPQVLADTPFAGDIAQSTTLAAVLTWAADARTRVPAASAAEVAAAARIQGLSLDDLDLSNSGVDSLSLASMVLGAAKLADIQIAGTGTNTERWQHVLDAQGIALQVDGTTVLAEADAAGLDIGHSGVEGAILRNLPIADTLFDTIPMRSAQSSLFLTDTPLGDLDVATLDLATQAALFGSTKTGTLAANQAALLDSATVADLAQGAPGDLTLGTLLFSLLDSGSYPWEQISPAAIDPSATVRAAGGYGCDGQKRCGVSAQFTFTFDAGPGQPNAFAAPTASVSLPAGTVPIENNAYIANASGPVMSLDRVAYQGPIQLDGNLVRFPLADAAGGTSIEFEIAYTTSTQPGQSSATGALTSGDLTASLRMNAYYTDDRSLDNRANNRDSQGWVDGEFEREPLQDGRIYYETLAAEPSTYTDNGPILGAVIDEDYFLVNAPLPGKRLIISTNATDGQLALALFATSDADAPLVTGASTPVPGTAVTEQTGDAGAPAETGADAAAPFAGHTLVDQAVVGGGGTAQLEAASTDAAPNEELLLRVTSGDGSGSTALYSLRAHYVDEPAESVCPAWTSTYVPAPVDEGDPADVAAIGSIDGVTATTNTLYLFDQLRFGQTHGGKAARAVRAALATLNGHGSVGTQTIDGTTVGSPSVQGAVLSVDADPGVQAARRTLDANPCSMSARRALTAAVNSFVSAQLGDHRAQITSIVIVGGDDILPLAPVAQQTGQFNEASHAASLRRTTAPDGSTCPDPAKLSPGAADVCATPLSSAAATNHILTDDPYGLANAYESLGGHLYVPTVGVGRLVDSPTQILATIHRFVDANGVLKADSALTGGYGAWAELPGLVAQNLTWRSLTANTTLGSANADKTWSKADAVGSLFPATGKTAGVVSINTHADETQLLPGVLGADAGRFADGDLLHAGNYTASPQLDGSLLFMIGCHAGNNLPTAYYGDVADWADVFSQAGGFVGNTGYGLANNVTTALGERLLSLYSNWIGVEAAGRPVSAAGALTYAKQSYLGGLGLYSGYDEKALMEAVYYGLPMYTFATPTKAQPLPQIPALTKVAGPSEGLLSASLTLTPSFEKKTVKDAAGKDVAYLAAAANSAPTAVQDSLAVPGQPILPRVVSRLDPALMPAGMVPRGALIKELTSTVTDITVPAFAEATIGVTQPSPARSDVAFPSTFANVTRQGTPTGPVDLLVVTPGRVDAPAGGKGVVEKFDTMDLEVVYGPATSTDTTAPGFRAVVTPLPGARTFSVFTDADVTSVRLLVQPIGSAGSTPWASYQMSKPGTAWVVDIDITGPVRWIVQAVDAAGHVGIDTGRGRLPTAGLSAPRLGAPGDAVSVALGDRVVRSVVVNANSTDGLDGSFAIIDAAGNAVASGAAEITQDSAHVVHVVLDHVTTIPGAFSAAVTVCRLQLCESTSFPLEVTVANTPPTATVELTSSAAAVWPDSTLTATAVGADADGDAVTLAYAWTRNGVPIDNGAAVLALSGIAQPGDVIGVTVTPADARGGGHPASATVLVKEPPAQPTGPHITATATAGGGAYVAGTWSRTPVTVTFSCTSGAMVVECPASVTIANTDDDGEVVLGEMQDSLHRTAQAQVVVLADGTAPSLAPTVTPNPVPFGGSASAEAHAADDGSGLAAQSCDSPVTSVPGNFTVECRATDVAGNLGTASARFTVQAPTPPTISASATTAGGQPYVEGTSSGSAVTVTFTCTAPTPLKAACPAPRTVSDDTPAAGVTVTGSIEDLFGQSASASLVVRIAHLCLANLDRKALAPVNADGSSVFGRSSGVPVVFSACDAAGKPIGTKDFVKSVTPLSSTPLPSQAGVNEQKYPPSANFAFNKATGIWTGYIQASKLTPGRQYVYRVLLRDGTSFTLTFGVR